MTQLSNVALIRQAQTWFAQKRYDDAERICRELLKRDPNQRESLILLAESAWNRKERKEAFAMIQRLVKAYPRDPSAHVILAEYYDKDGRTGEAIRQLQKFLKTSPGNPMVITALARSYEFQGEIEKALSLLEPFVTAGTATSAMAHQYAGIKFEQKDYQKVLEIELNEVGKPAVMPRLLESMWYLLGRTYEALGDNENAFFAYKTANEIIPSEGKIEDLVKSIDELLDAYSAEWMKRLPRARNNSRLPIFIICRPRSGSTLVERIIASHPKVHAGGEREELGRISQELNLLIGSTAPYPYCIRDLDQNDVDAIGESFLRDLQALAPRAQRVTDKYITNWPYLGLISLLTPKASIIDLRRDPIDNCLGIYTAQLKFTQPFTRDLREIAIHNRLYERVMDHWHAVLDMPILKVNYEDLVADQELWSRRIIEHCGLEWDDRCLRFYEKGAQQSSTAAPTLSFKQVRQPIYKSSVARAKKFEKHLGPLYEALGLPVPSAADDSGS